MNPAVVFEMGNTLLQFARHGVVHPNAIIDTLPELLPLVTEWLP